MLLIGHGYPTFVTVKNKGNSEHLEFYQKQHSENVLENSTKEERFQRPVWVFHKVCRGSIHFSMLGSSKTLR